MNTIIRYIASLYFWLELNIISAILFPISFLVYLLTFPFDKQLRILHKYTCLWSFIVLKINPMWRIRVTGRNQINPAETYVMVSNHQSGADIIVLFLLWTHFKWVAKRSLFNYPFIGWNMRLNRYISLDRASTGSMKKMMVDAVRTLKEGNSVMIFPEGTRSKDGNIQPFKTGAFHLALENKRPILPVAIRGTSQAIRKGGFLINRNFNIRAAVLAPIAYDDFRESEPREIAEMVRQRIKEAMEKN